MIPNDRVVAIAVDSAQAPVSVPWPTERDAIRALAAVACFVGVPALAAVGAVAALFALSAAILVAPLVAIALAWAAWHCNRASPGSEDEGGPDPTGLGRAPDAEPRPRRTPRSPGGPP